MAFIIAFPYKRKRVSHTIGCVLSLRYQAKTTLINMSETQTNRKGHVSYNYRRLAMFLAFLFFIIPSVKEKEKGKEASHR